MVAQSESGEDRQTLLGLVDQYALEHELRPSTVDYYRRIARVFARWIDRGWASELTPQNVSRFLERQQADEKSPYYRKSCRNALVALLRWQGVADRVRPVKLPRLAPQAWTADEVDRLIDAAISLHAEQPDRQRYWSTLIAAAWSTGLSQCDLERIRRCDVDARGVVQICRAKTQRPVVVWIAPELVAHVAEGPIWRRPFSREYFRRCFSAIAKTAGLRGSFKQLRKSSGSAVEKATPGRGHEHLGNSRQVFERHYLHDRDPQPLRPDPLKPRAFPGK